MMAKYFLSFTFLALENFKINVFLTKKSNAEYKFLL